ncbi:flagellar basal body-associated FliL family protein [Thiocystis violascens]|uniref:Flagellar protein FliL n=1 Tax=Thiocystis violascens (strain ATCC 17096 / DSM 198 / 6111) TaxID=765911 RepID=I3Y615_THIV6|nr:flagellar basal body-associated FliL family protein [Thiocystis violascens]AFL72433.1 flagellar basal body-associated protein [Thiocystis violascens DSM 198]
MAEKATEPKPSKGSSGKLKLIILILVVLLILAAGGGAAYYFLFRGAAEPAEEGGASDESASESASEPVAEPVAVTAPPKPPLEEAPLIYHALEPVTVNITAPGPVRFLRLNITVVTRDQNVIAAVEKHLPLIRNDLLAHLSGQNYSTVNTPEGKDALRGELKSMLINVLTRAREPAGVEDILFTDLVMQ